MEAQQDTKNQNLAKSLAKSEEKVAVVFISSLDNCISLHLRDQLVENKNAAEDITSMHKLKPSSEEQLMYYVNSITKNLSVEQIDLFTNELLKSSDNNPPKLNRHRQEQVSLI